MNLKQIKDFVSSDTTIVFHSTSSREELADIIFNNKFQAGRGGGKMLGPGFYANQHLYQAQKGNYGSYILKARIFGIKDFLFLDKDTYEEVHKTQASKDFVWEQINAKGLGDIITKDFINRNKDLGSTARLASPLWDAYGKYLYKRFGGFVYTGLYDKESVVCWRPDRQVQPLEWSDDKGKTWKPLKSFSEYDSGDKATNLKKAEAVRSYQRAKDLIERYRNQTDDKLVKAIKSQLSRIIDPAKKEVRLAIFTQLLKTLRPTIESIK